MKICIATTIFGPNEILIDKNLNSLKSLLNLKNINVDFYFAGWINDKSKWKNFDEIIKKFNPKKYVKYNRNYGKAYTINNLTLDLNGYDYLLTFDSDIVFKENIDYISNLIDISTNIENLGVLSLYQEEQNCHLVQLLNKSKSINGFNIIWNKRLQGIAGGCLWIDFNFWKSINGYRVMGVYAGEDSFIFRDAFNNNKFSGLIKNLPVIHPKETNMEYQKWKIKVCQRDTKNKIVRNLTDQITESMNFWNKNS